MSKEYVNYHKHSYYSNISSPDSTVSPLDYVKRAKELGHTMVSCMEHGTSAGYYEYYDLCKQHNMKFLYSVEAYFSELDNKEDKINSHLCIIALTQKAFKSINKIISKANMENFYYKPRVALDWLLELDNPNEFFITTACVAGVWKRENREEIILKLKDKFKNNFMLEIQYHNTPLQKKVNLEILELSKKHDIGIIMGCDSHMILESQNEDRDALLYAKGIHYEDEEGWYLDYPSYEVCVDRFLEQGVFEIIDINIAIENTKILLSAEEIIIDKNIKIPSMYKDKTQIEKNNILLDIIKYKLIEKFDNLNLVPNEYREAVSSEFNIIKETNMADYFLLNYNIIKLGKEKGGNLTLTSRGSCPSWYLTNLLGFTTIDRVNAPIVLYPERFATSARVLSGSLFDIDFNVSDRTPFIEAQKEILGNDNSYWFSSYGKLKTKSAWKMFAKANNISFEISNTITKYIDDYETAIKYAEDDEKEFILPEQFIPKEYIDTFNGSKKYMGIVDSISVHPCGWLLLSNPISEEIGVIKAGNDYCANIDGLYAEKYMYMKNDLLQVTVVDIIYRTYNKIGLNPPSSSELINKTKYDSKVWDIYKDGYTMCLNQVEQPKTRDKIMKYKVKNIAELSYFVCAVRPSFSSMLNTFLNREHFSYGIKAFDELLQDEYLKDSYVLTQEQIMKVLGYAGFPMSETYSIMKSISKKRADKIMSIKEKFIDEFAKKIMESED